MKILGLERRAGGVVVFVQLNSTRAVAVPWPKDSISAEEEVVAQHLAVNRLLLRTIVRLCKILKDNDSLTDTQKWELSALGRDCEDTLNT